MMSAARATRTAVFVLAFLVAASAACAEASELPLRLDGEHVAIHAAETDTRDYTRLAAVMDSAYVRIRDRLQPGFDDRVDVLIYPSQPELWLAALGTSQPSHPIRGLCDVDGRRILLTSIYEDCYPDRHRYRVPVHELTHIIYSHGFIWIREGIAHYESGMLEPFEVEHLPERESDLSFYRDVEETRRSYSLAAWIVKYIVEEIGRGEYDAFLEFAARDADYGVLGFESEDAFFKAWNGYMEEVSREGRRDPGEPSQG